MELTGEPEVACLRTESVTYWMKKTNVARCAITLHKYTTTYKTNVLLSHDRKFMVQQFETTSLHACVSLKM